MIDLSALPKEPLSALENVIARILGKISHLTNPNAEFKNHSSAVLDEVSYLYKVAEVSLCRSKDDELIEFAGNRLKFDRRKTVGTAYQELQRLQDFVMLRELDRHFLGEEDAEQFDHAKLSKDEKLEISEILARAKDHAFKAEYLGAHQKRNILYHINKADGELLKERTGFQEFIAAAYVTSGLVKQFGNDAKPLAEAVQTAMSKAEATVEGQKKIAAEAKPKQIEGPKETD